MCLGSTHVLIPNTHKGSFLEISPTSLKLPIVALTKCIPSAYPALPQVQTNSDPISAAAVPQYLRSSFTNCPVLDSVNLRQTNIHLHTH